MTRAIIVLSGGQDSTTCLFWAKQHFDEVQAVTINYGQRHSRELEAARMIACITETPIERIDVPDVLVGTSPLTNRGETLEQYPDWQSLPGGLEKTFVPMRNQFFLTLAANRAVAAGANSLVTGVCQEDFGGYPDCRAEFIESLENTITLGLGLELTDPFDIHTPLMHMTKAESVKMALSLEGCYEALAYSHTAYDGAYPPVGHDHATLLRAKGFEQAGVPDPLIVRAYWEGKVSLPNTPNYQNFYDQIVQFQPNITAHFRQVLHAITSLKQAFPQ